MYINSERCMDQRGDVSGFWKDLHPWYGLQKNPLIIIRLVCEH